MCLFLRRMEFLQQRWLISDYRAVPESEMMTMYLGTLVLLILSSIGWLLSCWTTSSIRSKLTSIPLPLCSGKFAAGKLPTTSWPSPMAIIKHVTMEQKRPHLGLIPKDCPAELVEIMKSCWSFDPNGRPSFTEIIERLSKVPVFF